VWLLLANVDDVDLVALLGPLLERSERRRWTELERMHKPAVAYLKRWPRFDPRFTCAVESSPSVDSLLGLLRMRGAGESCTVIGLQRPYGFAEALLETALTDVSSCLGVRDGSVENYLLVAVPGLLALSHDDYFHYTLIHRRLEES